MSLREWMERANNIIAQDQTQELPDAHPVCTYEWQKVEFALAVDKDGCWYVLDVTGENCRYIGLHVKSIVRAKWLANRWAEASQHPVLARKGEIEWKI